MAIGIDPTVDFAFKKLLGSPEHPAITLHFLNAVLGGNPEITEVEILNPILDRDYDEDRLSILDISARDAHGKLFNIEMQTTLQSELPERLAYYVCSLFVGQLGRGDSYQELRPAIGICVLDGILLPDSVAIHSDFRLRSVESVLTDHLQIHLLELPKYQLPSDNGKITDPIEAWVYFLRRAQYLTADQVADRLGSQTFVEAVGVLEMIARTPRERELYEARLKLQRDEESRLRHAREQGLEQGLERGLQQGHLAGRLQTLQEIVGDPVTPIDDLRSQSAENLSSRISEIQRRLRDRDA